MANGSNQSDTHSPLDFFNEEMRMFVEDGELSSGVTISDPEGTSVALSSIVSDAWKRAEGWKSCGFCSYPDAERNGAYVPSA